MIKILSFVFLAGVAFAPGTSQADDLEEQLNGIWDVVPDSPWNRGEQVAWVHYTTYGEYGVGAKDGRRARGSLEIVDDHTIRMEVPDGTFEEAKVFISGDYLLVVEETEITEFRRRPPP